MTDPIGRAVALPMTLRRGLTRERVCIVVALVPAGASLRAVEAVVGARVVRSGGRDVLDVARYLVREDRRGMDGQPISPYWHAPLASVVEQAPRVLR